VPEVYVDPPQLVTAGRELAAAGGRLRELRGYADYSAAASIRSSNACQAGTLGVFEESWERYTLALRLLEEVVQIAGSHTLAAADHYTDTDRCSADLIAGI
jgi:hypothetical protein